MLKKILNALFGPKPTVSSITSALVYTRNDVQQLLPLTVRVTKEMIEEGRKNLINFRECIGAQLLITLFPTAQTKYWWVEDGMLAFEDGSNIYLTTTNRRDIMEIRKPTTITLVENTSPNDN